MTLDERSDQIRSDTSKLFLPMPKYCYQYSRQRPTSRSSCYQLFCFVHNHHDAFAIHESNGCTSTREMNGKANGTKRRKTFIATRTYTLIYCNVISTLFLLINLTSLRYEHCSSLVWDVNVIISLEGGQLLSLENHQYHLFSYLNNCILPVIEANQRI